MALDKKFIGRKYGPTTYVAGVEKMREFAYAVGGGMPSMGFAGNQPPDGLHPWLFDAEAAAQSPHGSIVALPNFCVVFAIAPFAQAVTDPELGIDFVRLVHGEQTFEFFEVVRPGDTLSTVGEVTDIFSKAGMDFLVVTTESKNQRDEPVVRGVWTAVIRS